MLNVEMLNNKILYEKSLKKDLLDNFPFLFLAITT